MAMSFTKFILILVISDLFIVIIQSAGDRDDRDHSQTPRPDKLRMKKLLNIDRGKKSSTDQESSVARERSTNEIESEIDPECQSGTHRTKRIWTNEEYDSFLRLAHSNYYKRAKSDRGSFKWEPIVSHWNRLHEEVTGHYLKSQLSRMENTMRNAVKEYDGSTKWPNGLNYDLLKIYYETEEREKSKHAERMHTAWIQKYPDHNKLTSKYLLDRAETMLGSVMKFDLDNPQGYQYNNPKKLYRDPLWNLMSRLSLGRIKPGQQVDWKPKHDDLFRYLWQLYPAKDQKRMQHIYKHALQVFPAIKLLDSHRVYDRARFVSIKAEEEHKTSNDQNHSSIVRGPNHNDEWVPSTSSNPGTSHNHPNLELRLNTVNADDKEPDTTLKLGW